jgi:glutamine cyclotransferase
MKTVSAFLVLSAFIFLVSCGNNDQPSDKNNSAETGIPAPTNITYQIVNQFPHDSLSFIEGFSFYNGQLYESTGAPDEPASNGTWVGPIDLKSGKFERKIDMGKAHFGEGITFLNDKLYQLTWKEKKGFIYDAKTFKKLRDFSYNSEGWGLTNDGRNLIMSTGSSNLYFLDPDSLKFIKMLAVQDNQGYVNNINELEYINGYIVANQWLTGNLVKIDPATGYVVGKLDLSKLYSEIKTKYPNAEEMNGIAYDSVSQKTYITGKKWPFIYQIKW